MPCCNGADTDIDIRRESEQTSAGSFLARELGEALKLGKQMTVAAKGSSFAETGALNSLVEKGYHTQWCYFDNQVKRLQVRIAKVTRENKYRVTRFFTELLKGLSHMPGDRHVWFLGEAVTVTSLPYPSQRS